MALEPGAEALIFLALLLALALDLYQVGYHFTIISRKNISYRNCFSRRRAAGTIERDNGSVTDQLFLSIWLEQHRRANRLQYFEKLLRLFPFSHRSQPQSTVSVQAVGTAEPPLLEQAVNGPFDVSEIMAFLRDFSGDDLAYRVESWWDLWLYETDWSLQHARVVLSCFGPEFDSGSERTDAGQEDLRIDFGVDTCYLPQPEMTGSGKLVESNVKSLLRLVHELDSALPVEKRKLETESGENFADKLKQAATASRIQ